MRLKRDERFPHLCHGARDCAICRWLRHQDVARIYAAATRAERDAAVAARDLRQ